MGPCGRARSQQIRYARRGSGTGVEKGCRSLAGDCAGQKRHLAVMQVEVDHDRSQRAAAPFVLGCTALRARPAFPFLSFRLAKPLP